MFVYIYIYIHDIQHTKHQQSNVSNPVCGQPSPFAPQDWFCEIGSTAPSRVSPSIPHTLSESINQSISYVSYTVP